MARKKKGELPSGSIRRKVFIGYEYLVDEKGNPIWTKKANRRNEQSINPLLLPVPKKPNS